MVRFWQQEEEWGIRALPSLRLRVGATRYRVPDVTVLDRSQLNEQTITQPPIAVFEVLSPEDRLQRMKRKLEDYRAMGIPEIWVIDPQDSTFYRYENLQLLRNETFSHAAKGIVFDMNQLKQLLD
jgi:Uma2 family endonuclease